MHTEYKVTIRENGRFVLPMKIREQLNIVPGDQLLLVLNEELTVIPLKSSIKRFQQRIKSCNKQSISLVDSLKQTRKDELENE